MANDLELRIDALASGIAADIKTLLAQDGDLTSLNTTEQGSLVGAINEVLASSPSGTLLASNNLSDIIDAAVARTNLDVRSTAQVTAEITAAIAAITLGSLGGLDQSEVDARVQLVVDSAPAALDTLNEIAAALGDDANFSTTIAGELANRVRYDAVQTLSAAQRLQACENIGVGNPDKDFLLTYTTARDS